jgi:hypothetical protein
MVSAFPKPSPTLAFAHYESDPNPMISAFPETSPTLAFAHCESNPNSIALKPYDIHNHS